ncbi:MAG: 3-dehydroquinate synthase [Sedimentisphaerales bacterium]|nr:3-dehydroquinate synthase [Sedimentisphaerales bacterium]
MKSHKVKIPARKAGKYEITIGSGILPSLWGTIQADFRESGKFIVTDANLVSAGHLEGLLGGEKALSYIIKPAGEVSKTIGTVVSIIEAMEKAYLGRDTFVVGLGGGTVGDIAGFAASVFKRGVRVVHIPTTTVAQADSAIGGKTGVDSSLSKNAFGAFWHPSAVYIDVGTLGTLDERQYRAGLVESVKHALIADSEYFGLIEANIDAILARESAILEKIAELNCRIKGRVVETDPYEQNMRRILNYGHTIGHAVESASGYKLLHGEAVGIGIIGAGLIEVEMGLSDGGRLEKIRKILGKLGVPLGLGEDFAENELIDLIRRDKKAVNKWPKFVLLSEIGQVYCRDGQWAADVELSVVERVLQKLKQS